MHVAVAGSGGLPEAADVGAPIAGTWHQQGDEDEQAGE